MRVYLICIALETPATKAQLERKYFAAICDQLAKDGKYSKILRVTVMRAAKGEK